MSAAAASPVVSWLVRRLAAHGVTLQEHTRDALRTAIVDNGLERVIAGRGTDGKPMTYAATFEQLFNEPLQPVAAKRRAAC